VIKLQTLRKKLTITTYIIGQPQYKNVYFVVTRGVKIHICKRA